MVLTRKTRLLVFAFGARRLVKARAEGCLRPHCTTPYTCESKRKTGSCFRNLSNAPAIVTQSLFWELGRTKEHLATRRQLFAARVALDGPSKTCTTPDASNLGIALIEENHHTEGRAFVSRTDFPLPSVHRCHEDVAATPNLGDVPLLRPQLDARRCDRSRHDFRRRHQDDTAGARVITS